ncbi:MAG: enhancing lycopene biosynthesis protein 2 [Alphaproteobacteria bacterium]
MLKFKTITIIILLNYNDEVGTDNMPKVAVILSGCGVDDGSEIHESVLTLLHLKKQGAEIFFLAPDIEQADVINHKSGHIHAGKDPRNVLEESARIARGDIHSLFNADVKDYDALIFPGGFGAAMNLSDFAYRDIIDEIDVELHVRNLVEGMLKAQKPIGFICISPASIGGVVLKNTGAKLTIGHDTHIAKKLEDLGCVHVPCDVDDIVIDEKFNIISTPAYMLAHDILEAEKGIEKLVAEVVKRARATQS